MAEDAGENDFQRTLHEDWGRIDARVSAQGQAITNIARELAESRRDTGVRLDTIQANIGNIARELSTKIEGVNVSALSARSTNWTAVVGAAAGVLTVLVSIILGFGAAVISPINANVSRLEETLNSVAAKITDTTVRRDDYRFDRRDSEATDIALRAREREDANKATDEFQKIYEDIGRIDERTKLQQASNDKAMDMLGGRVTRAENHIDTVDAAQVKRPEIAAQDAAITGAQATSDHTLNARVDAITARMNTMQDQLSITPEKTLEQMWAAIRDIQTQRFFGRGTPPSGQ